MSLTFADYINAGNLNESVDDTESLTESKYTVSVGTITLEQFESALVVSCALYREDYFAKPLAMKVKKNKIDFVWYDEDEDSYNISEFTAKHGIGSMPHEMDIPTLAEAKRML